MFLAIYYFIKTIFYFDHIIEMKQVDYFKFFRDFPEFLLMEDSLETRKAILLALKKSIKGKDINDIKLIPFGWNNLNPYIYPKDFEDRGYTGCNFKITFKKTRLFSVHLIFENQDKRKNIPNYTKYPFIHIQRPWIFHSSEYYFQRFMSIGEITNFKRTVLIDDMLK